MHEKRYHEIERALDVLILSAVSMKTSFILLGFLGLVIVVGVVLFIATKYTDRRPVAPLSTSDSTVGD